MPINLNNIMENKNKYKLTFDPGVEIPFTGRILVLYALQVLRVNSGVKHVLSPRAVSFITDRLKFTHTISVLVNDYQNIIKVTKKTIKLPKVFLNFQKPGHIDLTFLPFRKNSKFTFRIKIIVCV